jgi:hypothetical protein
MYEAQYASKSFILDASGAARVSSGVPQLSYERVAKRGIEATSGVSEDHCVTRG